MIIKKIQFNLIESFVNKAKEEKLCFSNDTEYYGIFNFENVLLGFTGIVFYKNKAKFKNHYVLPDYRGNGYFKELLDFSIDEVRKRGIKKVSANCTDMSINEYLKRGAKIVKEYKVCKQVILEI